MLANIRRGLVPLGWLDGLVADDISRTPRHSLRIFSDLNFPLAI